MTELYRPSNGTGGEIFRQNWCDKCKRDAFDRCGIFTRTLAYDIEDPEYPKEWVYDEDGAPKCTAFRDKSIRGSLRGRTIKSRRQLPLPL